jgi:hypothetical protein
VGLKPGDILKTNEILLIGDYIQSANRAFFCILQPDGKLAVYRGADPAHKGDLLSNIGQKKQADGEYFAIMQADGNFVVYRGPDPDHNQGALWSIGKAYDNGEYFALLQNDGRFSVYRGIGPNACGDLVWATEIADPVVDFEITNIGYHVAAAKTLETQSVSIYGQVLENTTTVSQSSTLTGSESVAETSAWSDKLGIKVGVKTSFKAGIPFIVEGKIEVSAEINYEYTWSGSTTRSRIWSFSTPAICPPKSMVLAKIMVTNSKIEIPYTLDGKFVLRSGVKVPGSTEGTYTGTSTYNLQLVYMEPTADGNAYLVRREAELPQNAKCGSADAPTDGDTLRAMSTLLDHARNMTLASQQVRTQNFNFFIVVTAALVAGYAKLNQQWQPVFGAAGIVISLLFFLLDLRGYGLHKRSVDQLALIEPLIWQRAQFNADVYTEPPRAEGRRLFISHRFIYRVFFVIVGLAWLGSLIFRPI